MGTLYDYSYVGRDGVTYSGQVVGDPSQTKYNYQPGQTYQAPGGTYTIGTGTGTPTSAPIGSVYQSSYTANGTTYDTYHYDPKNNAYYDVKTQGYDKSTGMYTPPGSTPVPMWSTKNGLGSEYAYIKTPDGNYHTYGGGGTNAQITPSTLGNQAYDYKFLYPDGSYYLGRVVDDGTYKYNVGYTKQDNGGTYSIYAIDATKPAPTALPGYTYTTLYHDGTSNQDYPPSDIQPSSPYYQKPVGYGGLGSETDYIQKPGGYYAFSNSTPAAQSTAVTAIPLPT